MSHVTFIQGIANKPPPKALHDWLSGLSLGGLGLRGQGVTSTMVYWADVLYAAPLDPLAPADELLSDAELYGTDDNVKVPHVYGSAEERAFVEGLSAKLALADEDDGTRSDLVPADPALERIPLPWSVKRRMMRTFIRGAHHYLFDTENEPCASIRKFTKWMGQ